MYRLAGAESDLSRLGYDEAELIDRIYEAAIVPDGWPDVLRRTARLAHCREALFGTIFQDEARLIASSPSFGAAYDDILARIPIPVNQRAQRLMASRHAGFITDMDVFSEAEIASEPLYQELLIPAGYGSGVATSIAAPSGDVIVVHCERSRAQGTVDAEAIAALDRLRPHFARAGLLARRLGLEKAQAAAQALELMGLPGAVLGDGGRILGVNGLLSELMPQVFRDTPVRIAMADGNADRMLATAIAALAHDPHDAAVRSIPVPAAEGRPPIIVHLSPVKGRARDVFARAAAVLVATPVVPHRVPGSDVIAGLFDLTPSEAKLAAMVAAGHPPRVAAQRLGVTEGTARTTLKRVLAKTGARRQSDLVGMLQGASPR
jgi:DNA-binding CsgD family transcriptional regulator